MELILKIIIFLLVAPLVIKFILSIISGIVHKNTYNEKLQKENFIIKDSIFNEFSTKGLAIDEQEERIAILRSGDSEDIEILSYKDILGVEILIDGEVVSRTSRSSQVSRAIIGGLLFGGLGLLAGALCGKEVLKDNVKQIYLKLYLNSRINTIFELDLLGIETTPNTPYFKKVMKKAKLWEDYLIKMIKKADLKDETIE